MYDGAVPTRPKNSRGVDPLREREPGRRAVLLHRLVYVAAGLGVLHLVWLVKAELSEPLAYAAALGVLLAARLRVPRTQ